MVHDVLRTIPERSREYSPRVLLPGDPLFYDKGLSSSASNATKTAGNFMDTATLQSILDAIDVANAEDPNRESDGITDQPAARLYGHRMSAWLERLRPDANPALQIAARAQHIRRWQHPRSEYPMDRRGYLAWRRGLYTFHAEQVGALMAAHRASEDAIERVSFLLHKRNLANDPDTQALEDAACLVFLEFHIRDFAAKTEHEKMVGIVRKTWKKMSEEAHQHALQLPYPEAVKAVLQEALNDD